MNIFFRKLRWSFLGVCSKIMKIIPNKYIYSDVLHMDMSLRSAAITNGFFEAAIKSFKSMFIQLTHHRHEYLKPF